MGEEMHDTLLYTKSRGFCDSETLEQVCDTLFGKCESPQTIENVAKAYSAIIQPEWRCKIAEVAWHDPLVPVWEGSNPVDLDWNCDVAILATKQPGMQLEQLIAKGIQILDCTNSMTGQSGVSSL